MVTIKNRDALFKDAELPLGQPGRKSMTRRHATIRSMTATSRRRWIIHGKESLTTARATNRYAERSPSWRSIGRTCTR